jgi:hypothetical protein
MLVPGTAGVAGLAPGKLGVFTSGVLISGVFTSGVVVGILAGLGIASVLLEPLGVVVAGIVVEGVPPEGIVLLLSGAVSLVASGVVFFMLLMLERFLPFFIIILPFLFFLAILTAVLAEDLVSTLDSAEAEPAKAMGDATIAAKTSVEINLVMTTCDVGKCLVNSGAKGKLGNRDFFIRGDRLRSVGNMLSRIKFT